jgi:hypothetical protein
MPRFTPLFTAAAVVNAAANGMFPYARDINAPPCNAGSVMFVTLSTLFTTSSVLSQKFLDYGAI